MQALELLGKDWRSRLEELVGSAERSLFIASPFITRPGVDTVRSSLSTKLAKQGEIRILTYLDVQRICQGVCDPLAVRSLLQGAPSSTLTHLPGLHAKVYIADDRAAIITSGNLTLGGLVANFEYGIALDETSLVQQVKSDIEEYATLGTILRDEQFASFCEASERACQAFREQETSAKKFRAEFERQARIAQDQLIRLRLAGGARHTVFAKTIVYLLKRYGPLRTVELYPLIQSIHPDLCDDSVDRIIDGKNFSKKWWHAARTAQQKLKDGKLIRRREDGRWLLTSGGVEP
jgi:HKD family nuclease